MGDVDFDPAVRYAVAGLFCLALGKASVASRPLHPQKSSWGSYLKNPFRCVMRVC